MANSVIFPYLPTPLLTFYALLISNWRSSFSGRQQLEQGELDSFLSSF